MNYYGSYKAGWDESDGDYVARMRNMLLEDPARFIEWIVGEYISNREYEDSMGDDM